MRSKDVMEANLREINKMQLEKDLLLLKLRNTDDPIEQDRLREDILFLNSSIDSLKEGQ